MAHQSKLYLHIEPLNPYYPETTMTIRPSTEGLLIFQHLMGNNYISNSPSNLDRLKLMAKLHKIQLVFIEN